MPELCVCVLSFKRLDLLRTTLRSIVQHLETDERGLAYELVWVDNGSDDAERHALHAEFTFEKVLFLGTNYGMAYGFNTLFFRLCSAPYFLTLEEDWEWIGAEHGVGQTALRDAMTVLRHDTSVSGVFLRPDTLDQFLQRSEWRHAPRFASSASATSAAVDAAGRTAPNIDHVEYATYCLNRQASYLWGPYSNGPGVYDRLRLQQLVGRQFGEPSDPFPDPASESNYCYRVGLAGLCSAILRTSPGCEGVHACNQLLFRHLGDERSHGYGKGRKPDSRWLLHSSNYSYDEQIVELRSLDVEPSLHWLSMYVSHGEQPGPVLDGGRIAILIAAPASSLAPVLAMARGILDASHAPELLELLWLLPGWEGDGSPTAPSEGACAAAAFQLAADLANDGRRPVRTQAPGGHVLRCLTPS